MSKILNGLKFAKSSKILKMPKSWVEENKKDKVNYVFFGTICDKSDENAVLSDYKLERIDGSEECIFVKPLDCEHSNTYVAYGKAERKYTPVYLYDHGQIYTSRVEN